jgi:epoxyqueuosine reductase
MKKRLLEYCRQIGLDQVGIAPAGPYRNLREILQARRDRGLFCEFEEPDIERRCEPKWLMGDVKAVIVCLFPYYNGEKENANLSKYTYSTDYHTLVRDKLKAVGEWLRGVRPDAVYRTQVDNGPLVDRYLAYLAGLGFFGINGHLINGQYGSYVFIGSLLTNVALEIDQPLAEECLKCGRCIQNCPGKAIVGDFSIRPQRCRSYITQKKGDLTAEETAVLQKSPVIFGCDVCQDVCPHNRHVPITNLWEFRQAIRSRLEPEEIVELSNKAFKQKFGDRAFSWRGKKLIMRNMECIRQGKR